MQELGSLTVGFIGFGHMGELICDGMLKGKVLKNHQILFLRKNKAKQKETSQKKRISAASLEEIVSKSNIIVLGMRPHQLELVLRDIPSDTPMKDKCIISLLAGVSGEEISSHFKDKPTVLRVMPNTPVEIGQGMLLFSWYPKVTEKWHLIARRLFSPLGKIEEIQEEQMDLLTVISGSGPALVMRLIGAFAKKAEKAGLSKEKALSLACQTFTGSGHLLDKYGNVEKLVSEIAVPGGVTEEAVHAYNDKKIDKFLFEVIDRGVLKAQSLLDKS
jgi:pyrroline-5-carboxylate reductase